MKWAAEVATSVCMAFGCTFWHFFWHMNTSTPTHHMEHEERNHAIIREKMKIFHGHVPSAGAMDKPLAAFLPTPPGGNHGQESQVILIDLGVDIAHLLSK